MSNKELVQGMQDLKAELLKISAESTANLKKIDELATALGSQPDVTPEVLAAFNDLKETAQKLDDLTPDAVESPVAETPKIDAPVVDTPPAEELPIWVNGTEPANGETAPPISE